MKNLFKVETPDDVILLAAESPIEIYDILSNEGIDMKTIKLVKVVKAEGIIFRYDYEDFYWKETK